MTKEFILQTRVDKKLNKEIEEDMKREGLNASSWLRRVAILYLKSKIRVKIK